MKMSRHNSLPSVTTNNLRELWIFEENGIVPGSVPVSSPLPEEELEASEWRMPPDAFLNPADRQRMKNRVPKPQFEQPTENRSRFFTITRAWIDRATKMIHRLTSRCACFN
ncbi:unnamed protein product [Caenorhabditis bovis]|uniref:Uncharacterized protein n=1 Tax=Caenorhabditis bovis TaxID=2654633 RepID=A0A8S1E5U8_9PELO|nr:unnamed protein product [Caenorhabditis bovis]